METNQGRELAGCKFTPQLEQGAAMVSAAERNCLALSVYLYSVKETDFINDSWGHLLH